MTFSEVNALVGHVPYISKRNARYVYDLITEHRLARILELGIAHGTATCYMAAALAEIGAGHVTAVDLIESRELFQPTAEDQVRRTGLDAYVDIVRMQTGYTWFLHDEIRRNTHNGSCTQLYDLVIIDGPKNWTIDGAAFFMCDKVLKDNGWLIFDDYSWTYENASARRSQTDGITHRMLSEDELRVPHIRELFELLVMQHPNYSQFVVKEADDWAIARKIAGDRNSLEVVRKETYRDVLSWLFYRKWRSAGRR